MLERTAQLRLSLRELQGRDRIARHMLTLHPLEETLKLVLDVIVDLIDDATAAVHLQRDDALAAVASSTGGTPEVSSRPEILADVQASGATRSGVADSAAFAVVPIIRESRVQGVIELERAGESAIADQEVRMLESFALEAGVAINDAQIRRDPSTWESHLDEILDIEQELSSEEYFDRLDGDAAKD